MDIKSRSGKGRGLERGNLPEGGGLQGKRECREAMFWKVTKAEDEIDHRPPAEPASGPH